MLILSNTEMQYDKTSKYFFCSIFTDFVITSHINFSNTNRDDFASGFGTILIINFEIQ